MCSYRDSVGSASLGVKKLAIYFYDASVEIPFHKPAAAGFRPTGDGDQKANEQSGNKE